MQRLFVRLTTVAVMVVSGVALIVSTQRTKDPESEGDLIAQHASPQRPQPRTAIPISESSYPQPLDARSPIDPSDPNDGVFERVGPTTTEYTERRGPAVSSLAGLQSSPDSATRSDSRRGAAASLGDAPLDAIGNDPGANMRELDPFPAAASRGLQDDPGTAPPPTSIYGDGTAPPPTSIYGDGTAPAVGGDPYADVSPAIASSSAGDQQTGDLRAGVDPYAPLGPRAVAPPVSDSPPPTSLEHSPPYGSSANEDLMGSADPPRMMNGLTGNDPPTVVDPYASPPFPSTPNALGDAQRGPNQFEAAGIGAGPAPPPGLGDFGDSTRASPPSTALPSTALPTTALPTTALPSTALPEVGTNGLPSANFTASPVPGEAKLEGRQTPTITIEKLAPSEVQVGRPATFTMVVRNEGRVTAREVTVIDRVPQGTRFVRATPDFHRGGDDSMIWNLGELEPGQVREILVEVVPEQEGEIGSVARVLFQSIASARTFSTRPELVLQQSGPEQVLIGDALTITITISNPGTGAASNVILEADIPEGLRHAHGQALEYAVGELPPGAVRTLQLTLVAEKGGMATQRLAVRGDGDLYKQESLSVHVTAPQLQLQVDGPSKRYVDRNARYVIQLANPGTAVARDVDLVAALPQGMKFVSANNHGEYDARNHTVHWSLIELPPNKGDAVELVATPVETGEHLLQVDAKGSLNLAARHEHHMTVLTVNELNFTVTDLADPIEVGSDTTYEVRVTNQGSRADSDVRVVAELPAGIEAVAGDGASYSIQQQRVLFEPLANLDPGASAVLRFQARGFAAGDHRVRVQVSSKDSPTPVSKEEATRVYLDR